MFLQLPFQQAQGEGRAIDGHRPAAQEVGQRPDVVLVAVGEQHRLQLIGEGLQVGEVRHDGVDARLVVGRKQLAAVHQEEAAGGVHHQGVHAELAKTADGDQAEFVRSGGLGPGFKFGVGRDHDGNTSG